MTPARIYDFSKKSHFFHCFEDCERRRVAVALGFWEACEATVGRMTLRGFGPRSNINGDRVWFYQLGFIAPGLVYICPFTMGRSGGGVFSFFFSRCCASQGRCLLHTC